MTMASSSLDFYRRPDRDLFSHWCPVNPTRKDLQPNQFNQILDGRLDAWSPTADVLSRQKQKPPSIQIQRANRRLNQIGSIPVPSAGAGNLGVDVLVLNFQVPEGNDGAITSLVQNYIGATSGSFTDGSGDLTWRLQVGQRWIPDFGATTVQLGGLETPWDNDAQVIWLLSGQLVQFFVNRSTASAANFDGGNIICGIFGGYWPR